jgi:antitoxin MazE
MKSRLAKWGSSLAVRIPKAVALAAKLRIGDGLEVDAKEPGKIRIRKTRRNPTLEELVSGITPGNKHPETNWGRVVGEESW